MEENNSGISGNMKAQQQESSAALHQLDRMTDARRSRVTLDDLDDLFTYHAPSADQMKNYAEIRAAAKEFARVILFNSVPCADQTAAIRKIREAVMTANAAVALGGRF